MDLEPDVSIKGLVIPIGKAESGKAPLFMRVSEIALRPAKIGFMRIAVIPQIVFKDCQIIILGNHSLAKETWSRSLSDFMRCQPLMERAEIQGFQLVCGTEGVNLTVAALEGKFLQSMGQICLHGVVWHDQGGEHSVGDALISLKGASAGCLIWQENQQSRCMKLNSSGLQANF